MHLDHMILPVVELPASLEFYTDVLGLQHEGEDGPFSVIRVSPEFTLLLAPWGTEGGEHLAFAMPYADFEVIFRRVKSNGIAFGDSFHEVGNMRGPGDESGAQGPGKAVYLFDPNKHLIEIRHYDM